MVVVHELREAAAQDRQAIEEIMAEFKETHRTFDHLVGELERLEAFITALEREPDATARYRLAKQREARELIRNLNATLNRLMVDEKKMMSTTRGIRKHVSEHILDAIRRFEKAR